MSGLFRRLSSRRSEGSEGNEPQTAAAPGAADLPASNPAEESGHRSLLADPAAPNRVLSGEAAAAGGHDPATGWVPHAQGPEAGPDAAATPADASPQSFAAGQPAGAGQAVPGPPSPAAQPNDATRAIPTQPPSVAAQPNEATRAIPTQPPSAAAQPNEATRAIPAQPPHVAAPPDDAARVANGLVSGDPLAAPAPFTPPAATPPTYPAGLEPAPLAQPGAAPAPVAPQPQVAPAAAPVQPGLVYPGLPGAPAEPIADLPAGLDPDELAARQPTSARRSKLRRRAAFLRAAREVLLRDLGGFIYEVHRTAHDVEHEAHRRLRETKLTRLARVDAELHEIETRLDDVRRQVLVREPGVGGECPECGELFSSFAHYCANCGLPLTESARKAVARAAAPEPAPEPVVAPDPVIAPAPAAAVSPVDQPTQEISPLDPDHPSSDADFRWPRREPRAGEAATDETRVRTTTAGDPLRTDAAAVSASAVAPQGDAAPVAEDTAGADVPAREDEYIDVTPRDEAAAVSAGAVAPQGDAAPVTEDAARADVPVREDEAGAGPVAHDAQDIDVTPRDDAAHAGGAPVADETPDDPAPATDDAPRAASADETPRDPAPGTDDAPRAASADETPHDPTPAADDAAAVSIGDAPHDVAPVVDEAPRAATDDEAPRAAAPVVDEAPRAGDDAAAVSAADAAHREAPVEEPSRLDAPGAETENDRGDAPRNGSVFSPVERRP